MNTTQHSLRIPHSPAPLLQVHHKPDSGLPYWVAMHNQDEDGEIDLESYEYLAAFKTPEAATAWMPNQPTAIQAAREALEAIADIPAVPFSRDPEEMAARTIEAMQDIARAALAQLKGVEK